jgi:hypothetical protein
MTAKGRRVRDQAIKAVAPFLEELATLLPTAKVEAVLPTLQDVRKTLDKARDQ